MDWTQMQINTLIANSYRSVCTELILLRDALPSHVDASAIDHAVSLLNHLFQQSPYASCYITEEQMTGNH